MRRKELGMESRVKLKRRMVGVRLFSERSNFENCSAPLFEDKRSYCALVETASLGRRLKADLDGVGCPFAIEALGLDARRGAADRVSADRRRLQPGTAGLELGPFAEMESPDVAIVVDTPGVVMSILLAYTAQFGVKTDFSLTADQAICSECTAVPHLTQDISLSLLCEGSRAFTKWGEECMAVAMPVRLVSAITQDLEDKKTSRFLSFLDKHATS
jgi:uncharacterized protein (DUF169 family)